MGAKDRDAVVIAVEPVALDTFRMLAEMEKAGVSNAEAARRLGIAKTRMHRCKMGEAELTYSEGLRFIDLHAYVIANVPSTERDPE